MRISDWSSDVCSSDLDRKFHHIFTLRIGACDIWVQDDADRVDRLGGLRNGDHACLAQLWTIAEKLGRIGLGTAFFEAKLVQPLAINGRKLGKGGGVRMRVV